MLAYQQSEPPKYWQQFLNCVNLLEMVSAGQSHSLPYRNGLAPIPRQQLSV